MKSRVSLPGRSASPLGVPLYMDCRLYSNPFVRDHQEDRPEFDPGSGPESPSSGDEAAKISEPSPKRRKSVEKRVVSVPIVGDVNRGRSNPPSDSWAWRKYGQKPIKGSPYPRGYYRCSSSKGCPARKQVERSHGDPAMLLITYASDHNHPLPRHHGRSTADDLPPPEVSAHEPSGFPSHPDLPSLGLDWLGTDVASTSLLESPVWASDGHELGPEVAAAYGMTRAEDETLFGDLEELPECRFMRHKTDIFIPFFLGVPSSEPTE